MAYNPNEPRDSQGQWTSGDAAGAIQKAASDEKRVLKKDDIIDPDFGHGIIESEDDNAYLIKYDDDTNKVFDKRAGKFISNKWVSDYSFIEDKKVAGQVQKKLADIGVYSSISNSNKSSSQYLSIGATKYRISDHNFHYSMNDGNFTKNETPEEIFNTIKKTSRLNPIKYD